MAKLLQDISIGNNLKALRKAKGLTQNQICAQMAQLGRPMLQSTYAQIESGSRNIFISDLIALKRVFHAEYNDFFQNLEPISKYDNDLD
ncbi:MAG: helix-turn-helix transcriptional regulator [Clostridiales bacterium]|jgi:transcriptional regulator with XRE-family HTH domain|nr:helix-turn-helix transcriptional regulator [Clostridiales bacterium]